ncbi:MAG: hypothetical protein ACRD15_09985 [Vicinamibacterales bacterium]
MKTPKKNWLEWTVFWAGLALVCAVAAYLAYAAATTGDRPPQLTVTVGRVEEAPGGFAVPVTVSNTGDRTAESVVIEVRSEDGPASERSEVLLALVPQGSSRRGWATFQRRPAPNSLRARVTGYEQP